MQCSFNEEYVFLRQAQDHFNHLRLDIFQGGAEEGKVSMGDYMAYKTDVCVKIPMTVWKRDEENV